MRRQIVYLTEPELLLSPETCSVATSSFFLSHDIRRDVRLHLSTPEWSITLDGSTIRLLRPDEQSTLGLLRKAVRRRNDERAPMPRGFTLNKGDLIKFLKHLPNTLLCYPSQKGASLDEFSFGRSNPGLITGRVREKALESAELFAAHPVRLSRGVLLPSQEIVLFNIFLDRMGMIDGDSSDR